MKTTSYAVTFKIPQKIFNAAPLFFISITLISICRLNSLKLKHV